MDISKTLKVEKEATSDKNQGLFEGKPFWCGAVNLLDGVIEEVHTYEEAERSDFHHSIYFSEKVVQAMEDDRAAFFFIKDSKVKSWTKPLSLDIMSKIENQIK